MTGEEWSSNRPAVPESDLRSLPKKGKQKTWEPHRDTRNGVKKNKKAVGKVCKTRQEAAIVKCFRYSDQDRPLTLQSEPAGYHHLP